MKKADTIPSLDGTGGASEAGRTMRSVNDTYVDPDQTGNYVIIPPDGGWGWVIVAAAFICNMVCDGVTFCFGIFLQDIAKDLNCSKTDVAITTSVLTAMYYLLGPLFCALTNRFGFRIVCMIGSFIGIGVMAGTAYSPNLYIFVTIMGVIGGISFSMIYMTSIIIVGFYFERWRAMATAIAVTGSAVGIIIVPQVIGMLKSYSWRHQFLFLTIGFGVTFICGLAYRPIRPVEILEVLNEKEVILEVLATKSTRSRGIDQASLVSEGNERFFAGTGRGNRFNNKMFPTAAEAHGSGSFAISQISGHSRLKPKKHSFVSGITSAAKPPFNVVPMLSGGTSKKKTCLNRICPCCFKTEQPRHSGETPAVASISSRATAIVPTRPLYRDDIFFHGSLTTLQQYPAQSASKLTERKVKQGPSYDYHMSVTRMTTTTDIEEQIADQCICCPQSVKRILATMFDCNLLKQLSFTTLMFSGFFTVVGLYVPYIYIVDMNIMNGVEENKARFLLSVIGFSNAIGRIGCGMLSLSTKLKPIMCMEICLIICGISVALLPFFDGLPLQYICVSIFGLTIATNSALRSIIIVDLYGLENLTNAFGIAVLFQGVASCIGLPVSGILKEKTGSYIAVMVFAGSSITISGLLIIPIQYLNTRERRKAQQKMNLRTSGRVLK